MNKKTIAIIIEVIPVISAVLSYLLIFGPVDLGAGAKITSVTFLLAFLGFAAFFVGRGLAKGDRAVKILGVLDWIATVSIIGIYVLVFLSFAY